MIDNADEMLGRMCEALRALPRAIDGAMTELADATDTYLRECYARGVDPDGNPWPKTEIGRSPAIKGSQVIVSTHGQRLFVRMSWHDAMHTRGTARGGKLRRLAPAGGVPPELARRFREVVDGELRKALAGA